jgi:heme/copper-type cytochrome/quinol oxidase subunit 2
MTGVKKVFLPRRHEGDERNFFVLVVSSWLFLLLFLSSSTLAQCAMCKANVAHAENAADVSARVNRAVLVLLVPTVLILVGLIWMVFHYRNFQSKHDDLRSARAQRGSQ